MYHQHTVIELGREREAGMMRRISILMDQRDALLAACRVLVEAFDGETDCTDILNMIGQPNSPLRAAIAKAEARP